MATMMSQKRQTLPMARWLRGSPQGALTLAPSSRPASRRPRPSRRGAERCRPLEGQGGRQRSLHRNRRVVFAMEDDGDWTLGIGGQCQSSDQLLAVPGLHRHQALGQTFGGDSRGRRAQERQGQHSILQVKEPSSSAPCIAHRRFSYTAQPECRRAEGTEETPQ